MVRRNSIEASTRSSMADSSDEVSIHVAELTADPIIAKMKMFENQLMNFSHAQTDSSLKMTSMEARLDAKVDSLEEKMDANFTELRRAITQISNQLGKRPLEPETSRQQPPVSHLSDPYVRDDLNRLPLDNRKSLLRKIDMPKFDGSNAYDWLSKVERFFRVGRYSDFDKLDLVSLSLEGDVLKWFNWQLIRREFRSWEDFRRRLLRKFVAAPAESPGNRLFAIKQTGTVSASVTELEELSAQVIEQQTVYKEDSITQLQVPVSKLEHSLQIHIESPNVCEHVVGCAELGTDTDVSAYVTKSEELSSQVVGLDASHLEQIFDNGLPTEMKEVLKLRESMGLENQKKSRCLKASRFNFKRKKKRIQRWFNTLSCRESWRKHKHENLQLVSGLVGFNVGDFRCHKEYGLARLSNWSQVRVEYSLLQGELFCKNTLPRKPATSSSMLPLYVYQMGVSDIQDNAKEMVADPVSLQLILDVNKTSKTLDNQRTLVFLDLKKCFFQGAEQRDVHMMFLVEANDAHVDSLMCGDVTFFLKHKWRFKYKLTDTMFLWEKVYMVSCPSLDAQFHSLKFQLKHKWRSKHLHTISALGFYLSSVFSTVPSATSGRLQGLLEQVLQKDDEAYPQILDKLQLNLKQGMDVHGASGLRLFLCQQKFSSIWHRWRRKDSDLEVQLKERALVQSSVSPELLDEAVWIPEVGCRELLVKWQDHDASENFWMFSKDFVQLYPSSKLEDKLVFEGGSIDTIKQSYYRKKKPWVETEGFSCKEALEGNGGFAVSLEV